MYLEGTSVLNISYILNKEGIKTPSQMMNMQKQTDRWYAEVIRRILKNEMYIGNMVQCKKRKINYKLKKVIDMPKEDWVIVENTHEPIIEKEKFYAVQDLLKTKKTTRTKTLNLLLRGFVVCKECGKKMSTTVDSKGNHNKYMRCSTYATAPRLHICTPHIINYSKLEDAIISEIQGICKEYLDKDNAKEIVNRKNKEADKENKIKKDKALTQKTISVLDIQIEKVYEDKLNGVLNDEDFKRLYSKKVSERTNKQQHLQELENVNVEKVTIDYEKIMSDFLKRENITSYMLGNLIEKIEIDNEKKVTIYYKFSPLNEKVS